MQKKTHLPHCLGSIYLLQLKIIKNDVGNISATGDAREDSEFYFTVPRNDRQENENIGWQNNLGFFKP